MRSRIVFFGTPAFAVPSLRALIEGPDEVVGLICQADRPAGRGQNLQMPATKEVALAHGIAVEQPTKVRNQAFEDLLRQWNPDIIVVAAYGRILPANILSLPQHGCINVHASLLPKYRGAAPIQWAIARGESETGITIMQMNEEMDAGDILLQRATPIGDSETGGELTDRLADLGADALGEALDHLHRGELAASAQDHAAMTLAPLIRKTDGKIDWANPARDIARCARAFNPWPSTYTRIDSKSGGKLLKIHRASASPTQAGAAPGTVTAVGATIDIATGDGTLCAEELQLEGRKRLPANGFVHGSPLVPGVTLGTPSD